MTVRPPHEDAGAAIAGAPAKINLFLLVGAARADGYHPVCSLMEKIDLQDEVRVRRTGRAGVRVLGMELPVPGNTVFRAAAALEREADVVLDVEVTLTKNIPEAAGLGGGSSDAATVLRLLNRMYQLGVGEARLGEIALQIGADVPFFLEPGPWLASGVGELLERPASLPDWHGVLVNPGVALSTAEVYELYDSVGSEAAASFARRRTALLERLADLEQSPEALADVLVNDLEQPAAAIFPEIMAIKQELVSAGALGALMSGSGPSVFGIYPGGDEAEAARRGLAALYAHVWKIGPLRP